MTHDIPNAGFYHPDSRILFAGMSEYLDYYKNKKKASGKDRGKGHLAGIFFSRNQILKNNLCGIDALIKELEKYDIIPVPVFSQPKEYTATDCPGHNVDLELFQGTDVIINCVSSFLFQKDIAANTPQTVLDLMDTPVFQAVTSSGRSEEEWRDNPQGLTAMNQVYSVAQPEFNGTIEPTVLFAKGRDNEGIYGPTFPIRDRIEFFVRRINNWLNLKDLPREKRKVTILLHNNPCHGTEASLGGANGLDTFESVVRMLSALKQQGYFVGNLPENGKALTEEFLRKKAINEFRWTTVEEIINKGGVAAMIDPDNYQRYFSKLSESNRKKMIEAWGEAPGKSMVHGDDIVVTGLSFGNIMVVAEPKRGCHGARCDGQVCKILHDPEVPPTHQCYAAFKWIQENSDIIISTGTHGYIEFLPGKACGMSSDCFPEIITGDIPHIYIYTSRNPNEAIIAKRRAYAVITDHMPPPMQSAELYDELGEIDDLLAQYTNADMMNEAGRKKILCDEIRKLCEKTNLCPADIQDELTDEELIEKVHGMLFLLRDSNINNGLHILSKTGDIDETARMILAILKYDGNMPSIRRCVLEAMGLDYDDIIHESEDMQIMDECEEKAFTIVAEVLRNNRVDRDLVAGNLDESKIQSKKLGSLLSLLEWIKDVLYPDLLLASREIPQISNAMDKRYITPGPGGTLTRGKTDVLPTGRNIYSIDPRKIPTKAAWRIGVSLADEILNKHLQEENSYPGKIGMVLWSLDAYRADGEQLAQIMYLMGARPVWNESGIVTGVEPIPLKELQRPRIDVTIRTSEIFRDTLPNLIELLDKAVMLIAALDEDEQDNFILKNANAYKRANVGKHPVEALNRASTFRIFAAKPGGFGNGIKLMIAASAWKTVEDLGETFIEHGGYAYGQDVFGQESHREFVHNLKSMTTVFHKMETDETDPLNCCYNDFQGGMTAAVRALSGKTPKVLWGDTRDPASPKVRELKEEIERVVRAKLLNPQWIDGMKRHGYKGAQDMVHKAASVYGWDATSDVVDDWVFDELTKKHVLDPEMRAFYEENNPWALEELSRRFLEAAHRGLWKADPKVLQDLKEQYLEIEGWIEDEIGDVTGDFQGGSVDIITREEMEGANMNSRFNMKDYLKQA